MTYANRARRQGIASLENDLPSISDAFLRRGLGLGVDGVPSHSIRDILELENNNREEEEESPARACVAPSAYK